MDVKYIKDQNNNNISPVTLEKGVIDDNGVTLTSKLGNCIQTPSGGTVGQVLTKTADGVAWDDASGGVVEETDPVFTASPANGITASDIATWNSAAILGEDDGEATSPSFDPQADTVWNKAQTLSTAQKTQVRTNIGAQESLVSGTNIKTINNESLLGSGNLTIGGGGGGETNVIESISIHSTAQAITSKNVDLPVPTSSDVYSIVQTTQAAYDLLTPDSHTLYIITSA